MDLPDISRKLAETAPTKRRQMGIEELIKYEEFFAQQLLSFGFDAQHQKYQQQCQVRIAELRSEIDLLRVEEKDEKRHKGTEEKADQRHKKSYRIEKWILGFAIASVVIGLLTLAGEHSDLIRDTFFSRVQPSSAPQPTPSSLRQTPTPTAAVKEQAASSNSATPSPEQTATTTPLL